MTENRLILHIGAPKCGSTALQTALSEVTEFGAAPGERFRYAVIDLSGGVHHGDDVRRRAAALPARSASSANAKAIKKLPAATRMAIAKTLNELLLETSVILSAESWILHAGAFTAAEVLTEIEAPVEAVAYVRPQVDFLNAAWWQWGAWSNEPYDLWMGPDRFAMCRWGELLESWRQAPGVARLHARLLPDDVSSDFFAIIGQPAPGNHTANRSLPGLALRFMQRHRGLRANRHDSSMSFILGRALADIREAPPWVISSELADQVICLMNEDNKRLRSMLDPESQARMDADMRWWNVEAYAGKQHELPDHAPVDVESAEKLSEVLAKRLLEVELELAALKAKLIP